MANAGWLCVNLGLGENGMINSVVNWSRIDNLTAKRCGSHRLRRFGSSVLPVGVPDYSMKLSGLFCKFLINPKRQDFMPKTQRRKRGRANPNGCSVTVTDQRVTEIDWFSVSTQLNADLWPGGALAIHRGTHALTVHGDVACVLPANRQVAKNAGW